MPEIVLLAFLLLTKPALLLPTEGAPVLHLLQHLADVEARRFLPLWELPKARQEPTDECLHRLEDPEFISGPAEVHGHVIHVADHLFEGIHAKVRDSWEVLWESERSAKPPVADGEMDLPIVDTHRVQGATVVKIEDLAAFALTFA